MWVLLFYLSCLGNMYLLPLQTYPIHSSLSFLFGSLFENVPPSLPLCLPVPFIGTPHVSCDIAMQGLFAPRSWPSAWQTGTSAAPLSPSATHFLFLSFPILPSMLSAFAVRQGGAGASTSAITTTTPPHHAQFSPFLSFPFSRFYISLSSSS